MKKLEQKPVSYQLAYEKILLEATSFNAGDESIEINHATGRALAQDIFAESDRPALANSAMDGFCVRSKEIEFAKPANPITLPANPGVDAGHPTEELPPGHCAYIATGAAIPQGADAVVKIEDVSAGFNAKSVTFSNSVKVGNFIREKGAEQKKGQLIARQGSMISPFMVGIAASAGLTSLRVKRKPTVAVLTSGDELVMPWDALKPWQVRNANTQMLCSQVTEAGGIPLDCGIARDNENHARELFLRAIEVADIVVTSGGISMGRKDPFRNLFEELEIEPLIYGINMKPGKPFFFGYYKGKPVFALPGNQVSTAVTFELFVRTFIKKSQQLPSGRQKLKLMLATESVNNSNRDFFERGFLVQKQKETLVQPIGKQESHMLSGFAHSDVLYLHPAKEKSLPAGSVVDCILLRNES